MSLEIGDTAPDFSAIDHNGAMFNLREARGSWLVLYFYPKDDTPGCTTEACEFTEGIESFRDISAEVIGCSPDSPERHRKFIEKYGLKLRLLSDPEHKVMEAYGAWGEKKLYGKKVVGTIRSTVIIDPEGRIAHRWKSVRAKGHAEKVRERLEKLQAFAS